MLDMFTTRWELVLSASAFRWVSRPARGQGPAQCVAQMDLNSPLQGADRLAALASFSCATAEPAANLFRHIVAGVERNHRRFPPQQEIASQGALPRKVLAVALAQPTLAGIHFQLLRAIAKHQVAGGR